MGTTMKRCLDEAGKLFTTRIWMHLLSKDVDGELNLLDRERQECTTEERTCKTLKTDHMLRARVVGHEPCDSEVGKRLDGDLVVRRLVTALVDGSGENRGTHTGTFRWRGDGLVVDGTLSGMTNVGTHRAPAFDECQQCDDRGVMEGRLCGRIVKAKDDRLLGCTVTASYRFRFDPGEGFQDTGFVGTIEGLVVRPCGDVDGPAQCLDLRGIPRGAYGNPWTVQDHTFQVFDHTGSPVAEAEIRTFGAFTGLDASFRTEVDLPDASTTSVDITLVHFSTAPTVEALDAAGNTVDAATMTVAATPETLTLHGAGIVKLVVTPPQDETLILEICLD